MTTPQNPVLFSVTWDTVIGVRNEGVDEDGPYGEPIRLGEMVVDALVDRLARDIKRDVDHHYLNEVRTAREAATAAALEEAQRLVREALEGEIKPTNRYGEPQGEPTTLRDLIRQDIAAYLAEPAKQWRSDERKNGFRALLREQVDEAMSKELHAVVADARRKVSEAVQQKASEMFSNLADRR